MALLVKVASSSEQPEGSYLFIADDQLHFPKHVFPENQNDDMSSLIRSFRSKLDLGARISNDFTRSESFKGQMGSCPTTTTHWWIVQRHGDKLNWSP